MTDVQEKCDCRKPDVNIDETCGGCGNLVNFEHLRQRAVDTYDRDGQPIEDSNLPRRHLRIQNPSNSLRLLHLDDKTSPILSGTFERVSITHLPPYEAVSYCWGGEDGDYTKSEFIIIGGRLFPITKNCAAVLRKIREAKTKRVIWIDSLCINQNDVKERSVQVSQMGKIYSGAQKVHIYLGNNVDDETASEAFHVLNSVEDLDEFSMRLGGRAMSVKALFTQPYFSRMWIIQEVLLAKSAELHWGTATIPWRALSEGHLEQFKKAGIDGDIPEWIRIRAINKNFRNSETLGELLFSAMGSNASNDRDKVYGIYGLLFDAEEEGLTVDYGLSVKRVFTTMAVHLIRKHNTLQAVLRHANHDSPLIDGERLPSWVPDFRSRCVPKDLSISFDGSSELKIHSSTSSEDVIASFGENELYLRGHRLRIFQDGDESIQDRKIVQCKMRDIMWEIHANFPVTFKPKEHVVFWMSNGLFLHLKRHSARKDTYTFLGQCVLKHSDPFPTLVVRDRPRSFADAMFGLDFLTWKDLTSLWKLYTDFNSFLRHGWRQHRSIFFSFPDTRMSSEEANRTVSAYQDFCSWGVVNDHSQERHDGGRLMFGSREGLKANGEIFYRRNGGFKRLKHHLKKMSDKEILLDFENFWEDQGTWERLHSLKIVLRRAEDYGTQKINNICESWLQHNYNARTMLRAWLLADEDRRLGTETLEELKAWDMATEELSEALQWTMWFRWPCGRLPWVQDSNLKRPVSEKRKAPTVNNDNEDGEVRDSPNSKRRNLGAEQPSLVFEDLSGVLARDRYVHVEDTKPEDAKPEHAKVKGGEANDSPHDQGGNPDSVIEKNFEDVQARFNQFEAGKEYWAFDWQMLQRFSDEWAETIWSLPQFLAVKDELNLEMDRLFQLEESCLKRGAWRNENMQICPAETITLV